MGRTDIIQASAGIFRQKGYHGTSMQDIADAVHLQKASLYHHVSSKQEILLDILDQALDLLIEDMAAVVREELTAEEKLQRAMHVYIDRLTEDADLAAVLLLEHRSLGDGNRARHIQRRDRYEGLWRELLSAGMREGAFRKMDARVATFAILGVLNWMVTWYSEDGRLTAVELAESFSSLILEGLRTPDRDAEK